MADTKTCIACETVKPLADFSLMSRPNRPGNTYYHPRCNPCKKQYHREYYRRRKAENPLYGKEYSRKSTLAKHGMTLDTYNSMLAQQNGKCAICKKMPEGKGVSRANLVIDHDHRTGKIRGLLCDFCNRGLGIFRDDPSLLETAASYLRADCGGDA